MRSLIYFLFFSREECRGGGRYKGIRLLSALNVSLRQRTQGSSKHYDVREFSRILNLAKSLVQCQMFVVLQMYQPVSRPPGHPTSTAKKLLEYFLQRGRHTKAQPYQDPQVMCTRTSLADQSSVASSHKYLRPYLERYNIDVEDHQCLLPPPAPLLTPDKNGQPVKDYAACCGIPEAAG